MGESDDPDIDRIRSWARHNAAGRTTRVTGTTPPRVLHHNLSSSTNPTTIGISRNAEPSGRNAPTSQQSGLRPNIGLDGSTDDPPTGHTVDDTSTVLPPPAPPPHKSEAASQGNTPLDGAQHQNDKPKITTRMKDGSKRFYTHGKEALLHSWINVLLVCVPVGIATGAAGLNPAAVFAINAVAIIPLAGLLSHATESVALRLGDTLGALLNVSFGNAVELIIFIIALVKNEIRIVQASLLGSILSNLLLILGMAFLLGGLRYREQIYNNTVTQMSACLLSLAVTSLLLPTAFHASFSDSTDADDKTLKISRGTSVILLIVYVLYLLFQLKSHAYMYESTPQHIIDEESHPGILADMLDSSTSSDSSDTSSGSDTDTSGSQTTTRRIKRAFRHRRRRKSSASSTNTPSVPSIVSSPSLERNTGILDGLSVQQAHESPGSRRASVLGAIASGDEADTDGEYERAGVEPRVRDFVEQTKPETLNAEEKKRSKKHKKKHHRYHRKRPELDEKAEIREENSSALKGGKGKVVSEQQPTVQFADEVQVVQTGNEELQQKGFALRRPVLPKMLTQNVFVQPPPNSSFPMLAGSSSGPTGAGPTVVRTQSGGLRRSSSLPDRLNRQVTPNNGRQEALPPYPPRARTDSGLVDDDEDLGPQPMSRTAAAVLLLISTGLVAVCAEFMVDAIPEMIASSNVSQAFIGLIILPIVSNAAEHVTAVTVATKNKMDLAIGVSVGSSIQIALFVTPLVVILGWIIGRDMTLYFNLFETISLFVTAFVVNFLVLDGRSNYLEGSLLIAAYVIIA